MRWHDGFIAEYPSSGAFFEMIKDAEYQQAVVNRTAALENSRLVRFKPGEGGGVWVKGFDRAQDQNKTNCRGGWTTCPTCGYRCLPRQSGSGPAVASGKKLGRVLSGELILF